MEAQVLSGTPSADSPRTVSIRVPKLAVLAAVIIAPLTLAACAVLGGGDNEAKAPVVIPRGADDSISPGVQAASSSAAPAPPPPSSVTVTRTDLVTHRETRVVRTTAIKTLPRVTVTQIPAPITLTETEVQTVVSEPPPQTVTRTFTRTLTRTVTRAPA